MCRYDAAWCGAVRHGVAGCGAVWRIISTSSCGCKQIKELCGAAPNYFIPTRCCINIKMNCCGCCGSVRKTGWWCGALRCVAVRCGALRCGVKQFGVKNCTIITCINTNIGWVISQLLSIILNIFDYLFSINFSDYFQFYK